MLGGVLWGRLVNEIQWAEGLDVLDVGMQGAVRGWN